MLSTVTPFVGVWIEIKRRKQRGSKGSCHSLRGSVDWNQSLYQMNYNTARHSLRGSVDWNLNMLAAAVDLAKSLPSWECGLKFIFYIFGACLIGVTPFVGVWIEIVSIWKRTDHQKSHSLRGSVDWNRHAMVCFEIPAGHSLRGSVDWNKSSGQVSDSFP